MGGLIVRLLGLIWIVFGICGLVATKKTIQALAKWVQNTRRQTMGLISLIFGVLLILSAGATKEAWFIVVLGIISCLKGAMIVLTSDQKLKAMMDWWISGPELFHKAHASAALIFGVIIFYIV